MIYKSATCRFMCCGKERSYKALQRKRSHGIYPRKYTVSKCFHALRMKSADYHALASIAQWVELQKLILGYGLLAQFHSLHLQNSKSTGRNTKCPLAFSLIEKTKKSQKRIHVQFSSLLKTTLKDAKLPWLFFRPCSYPPYSKCSTTKTRGKLSYGFCSAWSG